VWTSCGSTRPSARSCTWIGATPVINTGWGVKRLRAALKEKDLGVLVDEKLNMTQQCAVTAQKASGILGYITRRVSSRLRKGVLPLCSLWWDLTWSPVSSPGALSTGKTRSCWSGPREGPQNWSAGWNTSPVRTGWESWGCLAWRREGCRETLLWPAST